MVKKGPIVSNSIVIIDLQWLRSNHLPCCHQWYHVASCWIGKLTIVTMTVAQFGSQLIFHGDQPSSGDLAAPAPGRVGGIGLFQLCLTGDLAIKNDDHWQHLAAVLLFRLYMVIHGFTRISWLTTWSKWFQSYRNFSKVGILQISSAPPCQQVLLPPLTMLRPPSGSPPSLAPQEMPCYAWYVYRWYIYIYDIYIYIWYIYIYDIYIYHE